MSARNIHIDEMPQGCILSDKKHDSEIIISSKKDALAVLNSLSDMLKIQFGFDLTAELEEQLRLANEDCERMTSHADHSRDCIHRTSIDFAYDCDCGYDEDVRLHRERVAKK